MAVTRVNEIDLLRFIAAMAVVFYHYSFRGYAADSLTSMPYPLLASISKYGYLGVELFFMISGFVILMTASSGKLQDFVVSRIVRLYPAFWACCSITYAVTLAVGDSRFAASLGQYLFNMTMLNGFLHVPSIDGVYWSLFVELRFYALVAIGLILGRIHQAQLFIFIWMACSIALYIYPIKALQYLLISDYSPFFIAGAVSFLMWSRGCSLPRTLILLLAWIAAIYRSLIGLAEIERHFNVNMNASVVVGMVSIFFVVMMMVSLKSTGWIGRRRWVLVGSLTYPLYLLHQNIGYMIFNLSYPEFNVHVLFWSVIGGILLLAWTVHRYVEQRYAPKIKAALHEYARYVSNGQEKASAEQ